MNLATVMNRGRRHWFYLLLPAWLFTSFTFHNAYDWGADPRFGEAVAIFDWCVFVPCLFLLCYRNLPPRVLAVRSLALACTGLWIAGNIVPDAAEAVLRDLGWLRSIGLVALFAVEGLALVAVFRVVFGNAPDASELERQGVPPIIAKMMVAEARFWRWLWTQLRGR